uniref:Envelope glycoprotein UL132 n=1 Tax=Panagrellus redivivus TaxID=6233 RepID=A0A7E4V0T3_PANRE
MSMATAPAIPSQTVQPSNVDLFGLTSDQTSTIIAYIVLVIVVLVILGMVYSMYCLPDEHPEDGEPIERITTSHQPPRWVPPEMAYSPARQVQMPAPRSPYSTSMRDLNDREAQRLLDASTRSDRLDSFVDVPLTDNHMERFSTYNPHDPLIRYQTPASAGTPYRQ